MADNTLTLYLTGDVPLAVFAESIRRFTNLVDLLSREVAPDAEIEWIVENLQGGSALTTVEGVSANAPAVGRVVRAYETVGYSLQRLEPIPFTVAVANEAVAITKLIGEKIPSIAFQTETRDAIVYGTYDTARLPSAEALVSYGAIKGTVETLSRRGNVKFTLYDPIFDKPITCYVKDEQLQNRLKDIWGSTVTVYGRVTRDPEQGRAMSVRDITRIDLVQGVAPGSYKAARGVLSRHEDDPPSEVMVRRIRDAE